MGRVVRPGKAKDGAMDGSKESRSGGGQAPGEVLVSFVLPILGDAEQAVRLAEELQRGASEQGLAPGSLEVIVVVADDPEVVEEGKGDGGCEIGNGEALCSKVRILRGHRPSRGGQMRSGAAVAGGSLLVFHHADNPMGWDHLRSLVAVVGDEKIAGGAFYRDLGHCWPGFGFLMPLARWWQRGRGILYGDQTCYVRREVYDALGGMPDMVLMEDVEFSRRLRKWGKLRLLDPPVRPDMSRFLKDGRVRRKLENLVMILLFRMGVSPVRLGRFYQRRGGGASGAPEGSRTAAGNGRGLAGHLG